MLGDQSGPYCYGGQGVIQMLEEQSSRVCSGAWEHTKMLSAVLHPSLADLLAGTMCCPSQQMNRHSRWMQQDSRHHSGTAAQPQFS